MASKIAARKVGSLAKLRDSLSKGGAWIIHSVPKDDSIVVRFLTEPEEWVTYEEVWDSDMKKFYPAPEGWENPEGYSVSQRYLACVLDVANNKVIALKLPKRLANRLLNRFDKYGTMMDRDYELERYGEGFDTEYDVTPEAPSRKKIGQYEILDLEEVLLEAYEAVFGSETEDDEPVAVPKKRKTTRRTRVVEVDEDEDEEPEFEDDEDEEPEFEDDEDEDDEDEDEDEEFEEYDEDDLEEMNLTELRAIAREYGIKTTKLRKDDLIEAILDEQAF